MIGPDAVPAVAARQAGVFSRAQALDAGWTQRQVRRRLAAGHWRVVAGQVFTAESGPVSVDARAWAAQLTWPDAVACGTTAGRLWGLPVDDDGLAHVVTARGRRARGIVVHVLRLFPGDVVLRRDDLRLTSRARTMADLLAMLPPERAMDLYAFVASRRLLDREGLRRALRRQGGRPGAQQLIDLLVATRSGAVSGGERLLHDLLREAGITGWEAGGRIEDADGVIAVGDVVFRAQRLVLEVDGERAHRGREAFVTDRRRQNRLVTAGWTVLRFTWWDLTQRPEEVVRQVLLALKIATSQSS